MSKPKILFVINPKAGTGNQSKIPELIEKHLDKGKFEYEILFTTHPKHASELDTAGSLKGISIIVAVGGDGTVNEIAHNVINKEYQLAIIPAGSGNGLARHLKIPLDTIQAIKRINKAESIQIDSALIQDFLFLNVAGTGFDALVSSRFAENKKRGFINYAKITINLFFKFKCTHYKIDIDGDNIERTAFLVAIANSSQYGNDAYIAPMANLNDGMLDLCILKDLKWFQTPLVALHLFKGTLDKTKYIEYFRGSEIRIQHENEYIHYDGEPLKALNPIVIKVQPSSINILK